MRSSLLREPSGVLPILMSAASLALVVGHVAIYGLGRQADEGTAAHLFQLLMAGQVPIIFYFAMKWLPRDPAHAIGALLIQLLAAVPPFAALYVMEHTSR